MLRAETKQQLRLGLQSALDSADRLRSRLMMVRALNDANDPGDLSQPTNLTLLLHELTQELLPLFESAGKKLQLIIGKDSVWVRGNKDKLRQALFCFTEYLFAREPMEIEVSVRVLGGETPHAELLIAADGTATAPGEVDGDGLVCEVELARRSFLAAGGTFEFVRKTPGEHFWRAELPLAPAPDHASFF